MVKATVSTTIDYEIAQKLEEEAVRKNTTVSKLIRDILTEIYKNKEGVTIT